MARLSEGILITHGEGNWPEPPILQVNPAFCRLTGYSAEELIGQSPKLFQAQFPDSDTLQRINAELQTGLATSTILTIMGRDRIPCEVEIFILPLFDFSGNRTHFLAIFRDLSKKKYSEETVRISETKYSLAIELTGMLPWTTDISGRIVEDCPLWRKFTGKTLNETTGLGWTESIHPEDLPGTLRAWNKAVNDQTFFETEFRLLRHDGVYRTFLSRAVLLIEPGGRMDRWFGICTDITQRKQSEDRIKADLDAMMRLNQLGNLFVSGGDESTILQAIVDAVITIAKSDSGDLHLFDPFDDQPLISADRGLPAWWSKWWTAHWQANRKESSQDRWGFYSDRRIIIDDIETSQLASEGNLMDGLRRAKVRALVSTPLISRSGNLLGRISTYFQSPHQPNELDLVLIDLLALQTADIIERGRCELDLRLAYQRLKKVLEVETVGMIYWDFRSSRVTDANEAFLRMLGYQREELEGRGLTWQQFTPPEYLQTTLAEIEKLAETGRLGPYEKECLRKDGSTGWFLFAGRSLGGNQCVEFCVDISDRKRAEQLARDREERLMAVLNTASDSVITIDHQGVIVSSNPATERLFGYQANELIGKGISILMPKPYSNECETYLRKYLETGVSRIIGNGREVIGKRKDGSVFPIDLNVSEIRHLGLFTGILRDISERKSLQRDVLSIAEDEQRRIGQDLHDGVQQDLAGIGMLAQTLFDTLKRELNPDSPLGIEKSLQLTQRILNELKRAHQHVRQISQGLIPIPLGSNGLMEALRQLALRHDGFNETQFTFKCDQPVDVTDSSTASHLFRIAQEAVTNSLKHSKASQILIELKQSRSGNLVLRIADNGIGLNPESSTSGLGLKIMKYRSSLIGAHLLVKPLKTRGTLVTCKVFSRSLQK